MKQSFRHWKLFGLLLLIAIAMIAGPFQQRIAQWWYERNKPAELPAVDIPDIQPTSPPVNEPEDPPSPPASEGHSQTASTPDSAPSNGEGSESSIINHPFDDAQDRQSPIPDSLNLAVPFTSQAPHANWDARHEEYCEEASALMVGRFFQGRSIGGPDEADAAMLELEQWQLENLGYFESTTAAETKQMIEGVYGLDVTLVNDVTGELMKRALADDQLVILPAAGRELGNPYFQRPGPIYHMLVVKGYTSDGRFITNDPGTKRGADFVYAADTLIDAVGDYNNNDPATGEKVMLVVSRQLD